MRFRSKVALSASCLPFLVAGCDDALTESCQAPFRFVVVAMSETVRSELIGEGQALRVQDGELVSIRIKAVDSRENALPNQIATVGRSSNDARLLKVGEVLQARQELMEFFFEAVNPGEATLVFENPQFGLQRIILVTIE